MGFYTRGNIVSQGLLEAGRPDLTTFVNGRLNNKLRDIYRSWPWPFLQRKFTAFPLAQGAQSTPFGAGAANGPSLPVQQLMNPMFIYTSDYSFQGRVLIRQWSGGTTSENEVINNPSTNRGPPYEAKVLADSTTWGKWLIQPEPIPDRAYLLQIDYLEQPADIDETSAGDSVTPIYPSDETLIQIIKVVALRYAKKYDALQYEEEQLKEKIINDRMRYGQTPGTNDVIGLDQNVFRPGRRS